MTSDAQDQAASTTATRGAAAKQYVIKDVAGLARWIRWLLIADVVAGAAAIVSGLMEYKFLADIQAGHYSNNPDLTALAETNDLRQTVIVLTQFGLFLVTGTLTLIWLYRINANLRASGVNNLSYKPGWSIGSYFVPIVNLWQPFVAMKENWKASGDPLNWQSQDTPAILGWWWFLWLLNSGAANASNRYADRAEEIDELLISNILTNASTATGIALSLVFLKIVADLTRRHIDGRAYSMF
jgi:hypothetical protein